MDVSTLRDLPAQVAAVVQPSPAAGDSLQALASAFLLQLETDKPAPVFVRTSSVMLMRFAIICTTYKSISFLTC
ncbi:hypothetical protein IAQ61_008079 [Plenodomus lingam]|uniref:Predicted protein n=1 Tax=Leptosphaeria maculans (strain JN3 / isolate v23.1.3 / race Av1-4-5-6-7-8) TaxID=985895 RepID=E5A0B6_LEPMJ|nr:predicted protein [Plenodomus lingam JN3]KAH9867485.1 hypothetical protein IAQ61_008079 [Plenodomus lingam]CBX96976.1 predicted protein [Plenodomus lingam JN3]